MLIISHKQILKCFLVHFCRYFMKLDGFTSLNLRYCLYPLNLNHPNFNIAPYGKNQKNELLEKTKCNGTKLLPHNSISLTFWTIFFTENMRYPFNIFQVIGIWGTKYLKLKEAILAKVVSKWGEMNWLFNVTCNDISVICNGFAIFSLSIFRTSGKSLAINVT